MSKVEKKDPIGDFFKKISGKSKEAINNVSSSNTTKKLKEKAKGKELYIALGALVILSLVLFLVFTSNTYETPIKNIVAGLNQANFKKSIQALPDFMLEKEFKTTSLEKAEQEFMEKIVDLREKYGQNFKISYHIIKKERIEVHDLEETENEILSYYAKKVRVSDGYKLRLSTKIEGNKKSEENEITYRVYKINGKWYTNRLL